MAEDGKHHKEKVRVLHKHERPQRKKKEFSHGEIQRRKAAIKLAKEKSLGNKWEKHNYWIVRAVYKVVNGVWVVVMAVGGFIAWLIGTLFI